MLKLVDTQKKSTDEFGKQVKSAQGFDRSLSRMGGTISRVATSFLSVGAAIGIASQALRNFDQLQERAARRLTEGMESTRTLAQISPTPEHLQMLLGKADELRGQGVGAVAAKEDIFAAGSAGARFLTSDSIRLMAQQREIGLTGAVTVEAAQKLQSAFGGTGKGAAGAGGYRDVLNKLLVSAGESPLKANQIAQVAAPAAPAFARIGGGDEGLLAFLGIAAETLTGEVASQRVRSLATQIANKRHLLQLPEGVSDLKGLELISALSQRSLAGELTLQGGQAVTLEQALGEAGAIEALEIFRKRETDIMARRTAVRQAERQTGAGDAFGARLATIRSHPVHRAVMTRDVAQQERELQEEQLLGESRLLSDAVIDNVMERQRRERTGRRFHVGMPTELEIGLFEATMRLQRLLTGPEQTLREGVSGTSTSVDDPELRLKIEMHLADIAESNRKIASNSERPKGATNVNAHND